FSFLEKHPNEFTTLWNDCGIRYFSRYSEKLLIESALNVQDPIRKEKSPSALLIYNQADDKGSFYLGGDSLDSIVKNNYRVVLYEANNEQKFFDAVVEAGSQKPIDLLLIAGHGTQNSVQLSGMNLIDEKNYLELTDSDIITEIMQYLGNNSTVIFNSCSTGSEEVGAKPSEWKSIAGKFSKIAAENGKKVEVFAPRTPSGGVNIKFKNGKVVDVLYGGSETKQFSIEPYSLSKEKKS
ncbi:hypothetical protein KJ780_05375, partial [Candidatus Micrarchaeota archaeon]|nr:hypothetical protein [Candidatus Micrarchaeota archaeon]